MNYNWIKIYTSSEPFKIDLLKGLLKEHDITAMSVNKQDSSYLAFGEIELFVDAKDVLQTKILINNRQEDGSNT